VGDDPGGTRRQACLVGVIFLIGASGPRPKTVDSSAGGWLDFKELLQSGGSFFGTDLARTATRYTTKMPLEAKKTAKWLSDGRKNGFGVLSQPGYFQNN